MAAPLRRNDPLDPLEREVLEQEIETLRDRIYRVFENEGESFQNDKLLQLSRKLDRMMNRLYLL